jgi:nicotinate-nucleotide adenylyltransferase
MSEVKRIGIMGGTFDPIHYGHLVTAEAARYIYKLDRVYFVPAYIPPHKQFKQVTPADHRLMMTIMATVNNPSFVVSDLEISRGGLSYTYDTVRSFKKDLGNDVEVFFITGADAIIELTQWMRIEDLAKECHFIGATRPGYHLSSELPKYLKNSVSFMEVPALAISSTDIRKRVKEGAPIHYLVPETVEMYIRKNKLYQE